MLWCFTSLQACCHGNEWKQREISINVSEVCDVLTRFFTLTLTFLKLILVLSEVLSSGVLYFSCTGEFSTEQWTFFGQTGETLETVSAVWKPPNSSGPVWAGLWGVKRFSQDISFCRWQVEDRDWHHQQRHIGGGAVTTCPIMPWGRPGTVGGASGSGSIFLLWLPVVSTRPSVFKKLLLHLNITINE